MYRFLRSNTVDNYGLPPMALIKSNWTVKGISPTARAAATRAARAEGKELGVWLSRLINKVSEEERLAAAAAEEIIEVAEENAEDPDDKLSSIERAMKQSLSSG